MLTGDDGRPTCYFYHKGQHIYNFEMSKHYCEEFGGSLVTIKGPKDQQNVYQMIQSGITASANSVMSILIFRYLMIGIIQLASLESSKYFHFFLNQNVWIGAKNNKWLADNFDTTLSDSYTNWQYGQPSSTDGCVVMLGDIRKENENGKWFVYDCSSKHYAVVCQKNIRQKT